MAALFVKGVQLLETFNRYWARVMPVGAKTTMAYPFPRRERDAINRSTFRTVLVVPLTKQTKHALLPGNVLLQKGEANLPKSSLARGTHVMVIDKTRLIEKIGTLSPAKRKEIIANVVWTLGEVTDENPVS